MGLLKHLLFWPVTGPTFLTRFSLEKVRGVVEEELTDDSRVKEGLLDLQLRLELGEIDQEEYAHEELRLMEELREVRRRREELGMGTRGGVVRVTGKEEGAAEPGRPEPGLHGIQGAELEITLEWEPPEEGSGSR